jgi:hypothetical protein
MATTKLMPRKISKSRSIAKIKSGIRSMAMKKSLFVLKRLG